MCIIIYIDELIMHIYLGPFYVTGSSFPVHFRLSIKAVGHSRAWWYCKVAGRSAHQKPLIQYVLAERMEQVVHR